MNDKVTLPKLAAGMAAITGESQNLCGEYIREAFRLVAEMLADGQTVRVPGLGTFRTVRVEARRSVDVNTGEPLIIPPYRKVMFTPVVELSEAANAPFAMFTAMELELPAEESRRVGEETLPTENHRPEESVTEETPVAEDNPEAEEEPVQEENDEVEAPAEDREPAEEEEPAEHLPVLYGSFEEEMAVMKRRRFKYGFLAGFLTAVAVLGLLIGAWGLWRYYSAPDVIVENVVLELPADTGTVSAVNDTSDTIAAGKVAETSNKVLPVEEVATAPSDHPVYDTVTRTRYLTTIAKEHYGDYNLWPYIYEENSRILGHPDRITPGTKVVVPPLSKYGVRPGNADDVTAAKRKGAAIYARYR